MNGTVVRALSLAVATLFISGCAMMNMHGDMHSSSRSDRSTMAGERSLHQNSPQLLPAGATHADGDDVGTDTEVKSPPHDPAAPGHEPVIPVHPTILFGGMAAMMIVMMLL